MSPARKRGDVESGEPALGEGAPTRSWPTKWPSAKVAGFPMSCRSAARRNSGGSPGPAVAPHRRSGRCDPRGPPRDLGLGHAPLTGQLRGDRRQQAGPLRESETHRLRRSPQQRQQLREHPFPRQPPASGAFSAIAASVRGSTLNSSVAANRTARSIRSASSRKRVAGSPTARRYPSARSARPPNGSWISAATTGRSRAVSAPRAAAGRTSPAAGRPACRRQDPPRPRAPSH